MLDACVVATIKYFWLLSIRIFRKIHVELSCFLLRVPSPNAGGFVKWAGWRCCYVIWSSLYQRFESVKREDQNSRYLSLRRELAPANTFTWFFNGFESRGFFSKFWRTPTELLGHYLFWAPTRLSVYFLEYLGSRYYQLHYNGRFNTLTLLNWVSLQWHITLGDGYLYLRGLGIMFFIDACLTDDEPLWEPIEWSLVQSWILFIFLFAWIAENLISSRYGSYTGRDKRVWFSWYKTFWLVEGWYLISLGAASLWVMVPHYYEVTYSISFIVSWWNWYSRIFFFKFVTLYTVVLFLSYYLQISLRWLNWKSVLVIILLVNLFLSYLLYIHFFMCFFGYFTDPNWYSKACWVDYIQLSHEPNKWSWGAAKRDHFSYHNSKTVFWFKNDGPFASAFLFFNLFFFISLFLLIFYWVTLMRRVYTTQEVTYTLTTYAISSLRQFFYFFAFLFLFVCISYAFQYARIPNEFIWSTDAHSWWGNFYEILLDYPQFLLDVCCWWRG